MTSKTQKTRLKITERGMVVLGMIGILGVIALSGFMEGLL